MKKRTVDTIVIHCSATLENRPYSFEQLIKDHKARGFSSCGYHRYIRTDGTIHIGRSFDQIGAHAGAGHNAHSIGICYEGGVKSGGNPFKPGDAKDTRTAAQKEALLKCIQEAIAYAGSVKSIIGHRDLSPDKDGDGIVESHEWIKQCPCFDAIPEYKHLVK